MIPAPGAPRIPEPGAGSSPNAAAYFDARAGDWDEVYEATDLRSLTTRLRLAYVLEMVRVRYPAPSGRCALDMGCGTGRASRELLELGFEVVGIDVSPRMIERAHARCAPVGGGRWSFQCAQLDDLPDREARFDLVVALGFLSYVADGEAAIHRLVQLVRPGGHLIVTVPNLRRLPRLLMGPLRWGWARMRHAAGRHEPRTLAPPPVRQRYRPDQIEAQVALCGCDVVETRGHGFGPLVIRGRIVLPRVQRAWYHVAEALGTRDLPPGFKRLGSDYIVCARRRP